MVCDEFEGVRGETGLRDRRGRWKGAVRSRGGGVQTDARLEIEVVGVNFQRFPLSTHDQLSISNPSRFSRCYNSVTVDLKR